MEKKTKKQLMQEKIIARLQEEFYVTDGELVAKKLNPLWLKPQDIAHDMQARLGVLLPDRPYDSWGEYVNILSRAVCRQGIKL